MRTYPRNTLSLHLTAPAGRASLLPDLWSWPRPRPWPWILI